MRGTKSRPNIKQPVFFDPDFPDHDPYRSRSPSILEKESFELDDIKMEPVDIDMPSSPYYNENKDESSDKLPLIVEIRSGKDADIYEPPPKKQTKNTDKGSPITLERLKTSKDKNSKVQLTVEKLSPSETVQNNSDVQKKFCIRVVKTNDDESKDINEKKEQPPLISVKKFASTNSEECEIPTKELNDLGFKKIKLCRPEPDSDITEESDNRDKKKQCDTNTKKK